MLPGDYPRPPGQDGKAPAGLVGYVGSTLWCW